MQWKIQHSAQKTANSPQSSQHKKKSAVYPPQYPTPTSWFTAAAFGGIFKPRRYVISSSSTTESYLISQKLAKWEGGENFVFAAHETFLSNFNHN